MIRLTNVGKEQLSNRDFAFLNHIAQELVHARSKYPDTTVLPLAMIEEVGEMAKALQDYEDELGGQDEVWLESVQSAAMCVRLGVEGVKGMRYCFAIKPMSE